MKIGLSTHGAFFIHGNSVSLCIEISNVLFQFEKLLTKHGSLICKGRAGRRVSAYNPKMHPTATAGLLR
jgi:hypothetical protein